MKAVGEAALGLPWISPCASSLVSLAKEGPAAWERLRTDPGAVLLVARAAGAGCPLSIPVSHFLDSSTALQLAQDYLSSPLGWVNWSHPGASRIYRLSLRQAVLAQALAQSLPGCDPDKAWIGGMLASLGWLSLCAIETDAAALAIASASEHGSLKSWDPEGLSRRLARSWNLPDWLGAMIGHLGLHVNVARRLGADHRLFQAVQLACALAQREEKLPVAPILADLNALQAGLGMSPEHVERIQHQTREAEGANSVRQNWQRPADLALLPDFIELALQTRRNKEKELIDRLHGDLDQLQIALEEHQGQEKDRLQVLKLSALAELAAGAGHEINNPLAVISGQAQYALKQMQSAEGELVEDAAALAVLHELRGRMERSLNAIVGQAHRIHHVLTDLMQFARPGSPRRQNIRLRDLLRDVVKVVQGLAESRKVRISYSEPPENWHVQIDPLQVRGALAGMLRNAIEAAPTEGWTGIRAEGRGDTVGIIIEDNGPGPTPLALEHMFDPFFSGRSAGRGRGLGLSTAWRLARQHGGDVRYEGLIQGTTRFVMVLPDLDIAEDIPATNGNGHYAEPACNGVNGSH